MQTIAAAKLTKWIHHPETLKGDELHELHSLVERYPYFQAARIIYLKALHLYAGNKFRSELKQSTIHITNHKQLLRYLNGQLNFETSHPQKEKTEPSDSIVSEKQEIQKQKIEVQENDSNNVNNGEDTIKLNIPSSITHHPPVSYLKKEAVPIDVNLDEDLILFTKNNTFAPFNAPEIIGSSYKIVEKETDIQKTGSTHKKKTKKNELIDRFIQSDPVMPKLNPDVSDTRDLSKENSQNSDELFSETLAKIYVKQKLYDKAIATYVKLSLKYPEKSVYFADRIEKIKENVNNKE